MRIIIDIKKKNFELLEVTDGNLKEDSMKSFCIEDKKEIIRYMKNSEYLSILLDYTTCIFTGKNIEHFETHLTDGNWIWSADIIHYFEKHNYILPLNFLSDIRQKHYKTHKLTDEIHKVLCEKIYKKGCLNLEIMKKSSSAKSS